MSKPKKPAKKKQTPKQKQKAAQQRQARARANYKKLREAGFSAKEAERYRYSTDENINQVIMNKYLPPVKASKQGAAKPKITKTEYNKIEMRSIEMKNLSPSQFKKVIKIIKESYKDGFTYFNIVITARYENGEEITRTYNPKKSIQDMVIEQGAMMPLFELVDKTIKEMLEKLQEMVTDAMITLIERYKMINDDEEDDPPEIIITFNLWKANT